MLKLHWRVIVFLLSASPAWAALPRALTGLWRNDNDERFSEMQLRHDGTFASLSRNNATLAVTSLEEQSGIWRLQGRRLIFDAKNPHTNKRSHSRLTVIEVSGDTLKLKTIDGHTDTYRRVSIPPCLELPLRQDGPLRRDDVAGRWRGHYRTHETEVSLERGGRATLGGPDPGSEPVKPLAFTWELTKGLLTITPDENDPRSDGKIKWTIRAVDAECLSFNDHSGMVYTFQRVK